MEKQGNSDIAAFPELFAGMEQFIAEQTAGLRRTGTLLGVFAAGTGGLLLLVLDRLA